MEGELEMTVACALTARIIVERTVEAANTTIFFIGNLLRGLKSMQRVTQMNHGSYDISVKE